MTSKDLWLANPTSEIQFFRKHQIVQKGLAVFKRRDCRKRISAFASKLEIFIFAEELRQDLDKDMNPQCCK